MFVTVNKRNCLFVVIISYLSWTTKAASTKPGAKEDGPSVARWSSHVRPGGFDKAGINERLRLEWREEARQRRASGPLAFRDISPSVKKAEVAL